MSPIRFCFGVHLHQPVGNFDSVFQQHLDDVYRPLLQAFSESETWPIALHISGPLLEWLERNAPDYVDEIGRHASDGNIEILCAGYDEPILAVLSRYDRLDQLRRHREQLRRRFGVDAHGLWLTERVWEPSLPEDLALAGVRFVLVDDRHFRVTGFSPEQLHAHYVTESGGARVTAFPIDEKLRYLVPFRPPSELAGYLRHLRAEGHRLAILADDGEKFGGWPGTKKWVYQDGWMADFLATIRSLQESGEVQLSRFDEAHANTFSAGIAYLPSASYREMEGWSLPPAVGRSLLRLERDWGTERLAGVEGGLLRGGHWRNFLVKYPESNRLHKTMLALSELCRRSGDPTAVRRAIGRAQCNDAYWHGVFGGLYLPHLRAPLWRELAIAEAMLRQREPLSVETLDIDADGNQELWVHSATSSAIVAPARGGATEVWLDLVTHENILDVVARHREAYHEPLDADTDHHRPAHVNNSDSVSGAPSIHDLETELAALPPIDTEPRGLLVDRIVAPTTSRDDFIAGHVPVVMSWARVLMMATFVTTSELVEIRLAGKGLVKTLRFRNNGSIECGWEWQADEHADGWFTSEISAAVPLEFTTPNGGIWNYPIDTVAKSEKGFDRTTQGTATVVRWPLSARRASLTIRRAPTS